MYVFTVNALLLSKAKKYIYGDVLLTVGFRNFVVKKKTDCLTGGRLLISGLDATTMHGHVA